MNRTELARQLGIAESAVRKWELEGVLPARSPGRGRAGPYDEEDVTRCAQIMVLSARGFGLSAIAEVLDGRSGLDG